VVLLVFQTNSTSPDGLHRRSSELIQIRLEEVNLRASRITALVLYPSIQFLRGSGGSYV
jgi:hypothetical protein